MYNSRLQTIAVVNYISARVTGIIGSYTQLILCLISHIYIGEFSLYVIFFITSPGILNYAESLVATQL